MTAIPSLSDEEVEDLLAGHAPGDRADLVPVAELATAVRHRTAEERPPVMAYPLRHAVAQRAAPVTVPRPRRLVHAAVGGATLALIALAGAANALPAPMQEAVADVGELVGLELPRASEAREVTPEDGDGTVRRAAPTAAEDEGTGPDAAPPETTPAGATPADPGTAGDQEPASPAIPPEPGDVPAAPEGSDHGAPDAPPGLDDQGTSASDDQGSDAGQSGDQGDDEGGDDPAGDNDDAGLERRVTVEASDRRAAAPFEAAMAIA